MTTQNFTVCTASKYIDLLGRCSEFFQVFFKFSVKTKYKCKGFSCISTLLPLFFTEPRCSFLYWGFSGVLLARFPLWSWPNISGRMKRSLVIHYLSVACFKNRKKKRPFSKTFFFKKQNQTFWTAYQEEPSLAGLCRCFLSFRRGPALQPFHETLLSVLVMVFGLLVQNRSELPIGPEKQYPWQTVMLTASGTWVQIASLVLETKDALFDSKTKVNFAKISDAEQSGPKILKTGRNKCVLYKPYSFKRKKIREIFRSLELFKNPLLAFYSFRGFSLEVLCPLLQSSLFFSFLFWKKGEKKIKVLLHRSSILFL